MVFKCTLSPNPILKTKHQSTPRIFGASLDPFLGAISLRYPKFNLYTLAYQKPRFFPGK